MCLGDWRLGRFVRSELHTFTAPASSTILVAQFARQRVAITIGCGQLQDNADPITLFYTPLNRVGSNVEIFNFSVQTSFVSWNIRDHGDFPQGRFHAGTQVSPQTVTIIESYLPEAVLSAGLESLYREMPELRGL